MEGRGGEKETKASLVFPLFHSDVRLRLITPLGRGHLRFSTCSYKVTKKPVFTQNCAPPLPRRPTRIQQVTAAAAVTLYFGAPARPHTASDSQRCNINTSQECDVLINSLCCSDRGSETCTRSTTAPGPLCSCQAGALKSR